MDAATTYSDSTSSGSYAMSQAGPWAVWTSRTISTSRSRDGSNRFVTGVPRRADARWWIRRRGRRARTAGRRRSARVLGQAGLRSLRAAPLVGPLDAGRPDGPRPDDEPGAVVALLDGGLPREQVADGKVDGPEVVDASPLAPDVVCPDDAFERGERPDVAERAAAPAAVHQLALADDDPERRVVVGPEPGEREPLLVPDLDGHRDLFAPRRPVAAERPAVRHAAQPVPCPDGPDRLQQEHDDPEDDRDRDADESAGEDEEDRREGEPAHRAVSRGRAGGRGRRQAARRRRRPFRPGSRRAARAAAPARRPGPRPSRIRPSRRAGTGRGRRRAGG